MKVGFCYKRITYSKCWVWWLTLTASARRETGVVRTTLKLTVAASVERLVRTTTTRSTESITTTRFVSHPSTTITASGICIGCCRPVTTRSVLDIMKHVLYDRACSQIFLSIPLGIHGDDVFRFVWISFWWDLVPMATDPATCGVWAVGAGV